MTVTSILLFTQSGCLNCEVLKILLEVKGLAFGCRCGPRTA
jgi:hypothetical protein